MPLTGEPVHASPARARAAGGSWGKRRAPRCAGRMAHAGRRSPGRPGAPTLLAPALSHRESAASGATSPVAPIALASLPSPAPRSLQRRDAARPDPGGPPETIATAHRSRRARVGGPWADAVFAAWRLVYGAIPGWLGVTSRSSAAYASSQDRDGDGISRAARLVQRRGSALARGNGSARCLLVVSRARLRRRNRTRG